MCATIWPWLWIAPKVTFGAKMQRDVIHIVAKEVKSAFFCTSDNEHLHSASLYLATMKSAHPLYKWLFNDKTSSSYILHPAC